MNRTTNDMNLDIKIKIKKTKRESNNVYVKIAQMFN